MPVNKNQLKRIIKFIALLKENRYPNCRSFARLLKNEYRNEYDFNAGRDGKEAGEIEARISTTDLKIVKAPFSRWDQPNMERFRISHKTISRDIKFLKETLHAPILFDIDRNGYYLSDREWSLENFPLAHDEVSAVIIGAQMIKELLPDGSSSKESIVDSVEGLIAQNGYEDKFIADPESFKIKIEAKHEVDVEIFDEVYMAWKTCSGLMINYKLSVAEGPRIERPFEAHVFGFNDGDWFAKGRIFEDGESKITTIALYQISEASIDGTSFSQDRNLF